MKFTNALTGIIFIVIGAIMFSVASGFPNRIGTPYGADLLPKILSTLLAVSGLLLVLRDRINRAPNTSFIPKKPFITISADLRSKQGYVPAFLVILLPLGQILLGKSIGYIPVSIIGLILLFVSLKLKWIPAIGLAVLASFACWFLFSWALRVPLPYGILLGIL